MNKKGMSLETLAMLILASLSLVLILAFFFESGLITNLSSFMGVTFTMMQSGIRGIIMKMIGVFVGLMLVLVGVVMAIGSTCRAFPVGTVVCAAIYATFMAGFLWSIMMLQASVPFIDIPTPVIEIPKGAMDDNCGENAVTAEDFKKEIAERSVDCWSMYGSGNWDPLLGKIPPNPRTCFVVDFNLQGEGVTFDEIHQYMGANNYVGSDRKYIQKAGNNIILENGKDKWDKRIKQGRLFIKYGDSMTDVYQDQEWGSPDCSIDNDNFNSEGDVVFWCIDEGATKDNTCQQFSWS